MASKFYVENTGRHHELLETLQKSGTLNRNTVVHISRDTSAPTEVYLVIVVFVCSNNVYTEYWVVDSIQ